MVGGETWQIFEALLFGKLRSAIGDRRIEPLILDAPGTGDLEELRALLAMGVLRP